MKTSAKTLSLALLALASLSACGTASLPGAALPNRALQAQRAQPINTVFMIDKTTLSEDLNGQQYGFDHLTILHRDAYGYNQDRVHLTFRRDQAMFLMTETRGLHLPKPEQEHIDLSDRDNVLRAIDRLQVLKARTAQHKAHIALAIKVLRRNLEGVKP